MYHFLCPLLTLQNITTFFTVWVRCSTVFWFVFNHFWVLKCYQFLWFLYVHMAQHSRALLWALMGNLPLLIGDNIHALSTYEHMAFINIRTQMQTILQFQKESWIWRCNAAIYHHTAVLLISERKTPNKAWNPMCRCFQKTDNVHSYWFIMILVILL